jgi:hypothetical protein
MRVPVLVLAALSIARAVAAAPTDDIADVLTRDAEKPAITAESLPADFSRLIHFIPHEGTGMVLFADGGSADGYVRHGMARFATNPPLKGPDDKSTGRDPLFLVAFELVDQPDFTFKALSTSLEQRLGIPDSSSNQVGATFRTWDLKQLKGRSVTVARAQASDNGDPITIVQIKQER